MGPAGGERPAWHAKHVGRAFLGEQLHMIGRPQGGNVRPMHQLAAIDARIIAAAQQHPVHASYASAAQLGRRQNCLEFYLFLLSSELGHQLPQRRRVETPMVRRSAATLPLSASRMLGAVRT
jgi:hypothetical protein